MTRWSKAIAVPVLLFIVSGMASFGQSIPAAAHYHELVPLGAQTFVVQAPKWHGLLALLASADSPQFEGMQASDGDHAPQLLNADGTPMAHYPRVTFRLTASFRSNFNEPEPFRVIASGNENDYLLKLKFRIVAYHGLRQTVLPPESVEIIGVPAAMPYQERIYRVIVDLEKIPVSDRIVFEVFDPSGARLCKFHLDLM
ncbi:MAG: hypothetical protein ACRD3E_11760 [Terriglobales bacterium]